jgi:hypothetical protein
MASSASSNSSALSHQSSSSSLEPEVDLVAVYNNLAPEWWDGEDWDFSVQTEGSDDEAPLTDGEADLQFLAEGELEEEHDEGPFPECWGEDISSSEEEAAGTEDEVSSGEYPPTKRFRAGSWDDPDDDDDVEDEDNEGPAYRGSSDEDSAESSTDESEDGGGSGNGSDGLGL